MTHRQTIDAYIAALGRSPDLVGRLVFHRDFAPVAPSYGDLRDPWPEPIDRLLEAAGIQRLYAHQVQVIDRVRRGIHTVAAAPTASGKTLVYTLPLFEHILNDPTTTALFIYPLKALAQDQHRTLLHLAAKLPQMDLRAEIYDGDTSAYRRKKIRDTPPHVLMTNPEMVHLSLLPYHDRWSELLSRLRLVVVDEVHVYRGMLGSHMAQVFRRLARLCRFYGASPTFVFTSATVANPGELAIQLSGLPVETVRADTAGSGRRHLILVDPLDGPLRATLRLLKSALKRELRTIVYTQSRKLAELLAIWARQSAGPHAERISAYRAGFLPAERRDIEGRLASGELLAVIATSALELGIDIGDLDLCLLVGYPGSIIATWQRGGRVGRSGQESAIVLVAGEDALDHYFVHHPEQLVVRPPEAAVINPYNPDVLVRHLVCAAAELPLKIDDPLLAPTPVKRCLETLINRAELYLSADGATCFSPLKRPHRQVDLRGSGSRFAIVDASANQRLGEIDRHRAYREAHPGAIYLHRGRTFRVTTLDAASARIQVNACKVDYHTRVRGHKETRIIAIDDQKTVAGTRMAVGRLEVTETVTGYDRIRTRSGEVIDRVVLDLPPMRFETQGLWFTVPDPTIALAEKAQLHVMGGLHALEHAAIGVCPLLVLADRNDLGGISTTYHPQLEGAAIFIYDGLPGGSGLCQQAYADGQTLLDATLKVITGCACETGCPSCVHSPKCGSGNRPIDKAAAVFLLRALLDPSVSPPSRAFGSPSPPPVVETADRQPADTPMEPVCADYGVLDIETQLSAKEVGGWHHAERMRVSCAVLYDSRTDRYHEFVEGQIPALLNHLRQFQRVVGFNIKRFDYRVLSAYTDLDFQTIPTLDMLEEVKRRLGYRLSLDHLASVTLNAGKSADGLDALRWWKTGQMAKILEYCRSDVTLTRDLYRYGRENRFLLFRNKAGQVVRVPVEW